HECTGNATPLQRFCLHAVRAADPRGLHSFPTRRSSDLETAKKVMADGRPVLKSYELDEELVWGLGLGCPGTVDIWIEPVPDTDVPSSFREARKAEGVEERKGSTGAGRRNGSLMRRGSAVSGRDGPRCSPGYWNPLRRLVRWAPG